MYRRAQSGWVHEPPAAASRPIPERVGCAVVIYASGGRRLDQRLDGIYRGRYPLVPAEHPIVPTYQRIEYSLCRWPCEVVSPVNSIGSKLRDGRCGWQCVPLPISNSRAPDSAGERYHSIQSPVTSLSTLSLIHISEPTRQAEISYAVFC